LKEVAKISLLISNEGMHFPSCNFYLKKFLGEPAQFKTTLQFGRAHQPIRTNLQLSFKHKELGHGFAHKNGHTPKKVLKGSWEGYNLPFLTAMGHDG
jgi:hypothetical protein